jgi:hypothetical protein
MKAIHWIIAAAAFAFVQPVQAATTDPEVIIYRFPGVHDDGGATDVGVATVFFCTNFSGVIETVRFVTRQSNSTLAGNSIVGIGHLSTISVATHATAAYSNESNLATGLVTYGTTAIAATSTNIICTAMTIDAANSKPVGVALRGIRFSPVSGSQE